MRGMEHGHNSVKRDGDTRAAPCVVHDRAERDEQGTHVLPPRKASSVRDLREHAAVFCSQVIRIHTT